MLQVPEELELHPKGLNVERHLVGGQVDGLGDPLNDNSLTVAIVEGLVDLGEFALAFEFLLNAVFPLRIVSILIILIMII